MSINESKEFEAINQKTGERKFVVETESQCKEEYQRVKKAQAKKQAIVRLVLTLLSVLASIGITICLKQIGWINGIFCIVLVCLAGAVAMFKSGYLWHEIKN